MFASLIMIGSGMTMFFVAKVNVFYTFSRKYLYLYPNFLFLCAFNLFNLISTFSWPKGQFIH